MSDILFEGKPIKQFIEKQERKEARKERVATEKIPLYRKPTTRKQWKAEKRQRMVKFLARSAYMQEYYKGLDKLPTNTEKIIHLLISGEPMTTSKIVDVLETTGNPTSNKSVSAVISQAKQTSLRNYLDVTKTKNGFVYRPNGMPDSVNAHVVYGWMKEVSKAKPKAKAKPVQPKLPDAPNTEDKLAKKLLQIEESNQNLLKEIHDKNTMIEEMGKQINFLEQKSTVSTSNLTLQQFFEMMREFNMIVDMKVSNKGRDYENG